MRKTLTGYGLKIIAMVTMFIDHVGAAVLERWLYADFPAELTVAAYNAWHDLHATGFLIYDMMRVIGRIAFPIYAFLLVEGVLHTADIRKYIRNLFLFALISEVPFDLAFRQKIVDPSHQNVMFTLLTSALMLVFIRKFTVEQVPGNGPDNKAAKAFIPAGALLSACLAWLFSPITTFSWGTLATKIVFFERINYQWPMSTVAGVFAAAGAVICFLLNKKLPSQKKAAATYVMFISSIAMAAAKLLCTDYGGAGVLTILLIYLLRENRGKQITATWAALSLYTITSSTAEAACIFAGPFLSAYNGERGSIGGKKSKYIFSHLLVLFLISSILIR